MAKKKKITFQEAFDVFAETLKKENGLFSAYQSNIAGSIINVLTAAGFKFPGMHSLVNQGAQEFLNLLIEKRGKK
jgi:hypothetical protein